MKKEEKEEKKNNEKEFMEEFFFLASYLKALFSFTFLSLPYYAVSAFTHQ